MEKIVITGTGAVSPVGHNVKETWENILNGVCGTAPITQFDTQDFQVKVACEVKDFNPEKYMDGREARRRDRYQQFATVAVNEALDQSGLVATEENVNQIGVVISSAIGGLNTLEDGFHQLETSGPRRISPFLIPMLMSNGAAGLAGIDHGFKGPAFSVASACASGQDGIGMAWLMLRSGIIDAAIAGASESTICPLGVAAFDRIGATSRALPGEPAPRPFDKDRDGLVVGEGCGILVLERESFAKARGANILAELAGYAATADAFHVTAPSEDGVGSARAITLALEAADVNVDGVDYINAHGTATPLNDVSETKAIKAAFGQYAYQTAISSTKSMTGHMMGATGALEAIFCVNAIRDGAIPPTVNYSTPDPECDLDYVPNQARQAKVETAISNAFGFGGHNAVLVIRKYK
jgi:3-oxoacyl-[acyl-carrier-protein] synthase II